MSLAQQNNLQNNLAQQIAHQKLSLAQQNNCIEHLGIKELTIIRHCKVFDSFGLKHD